VITDFREIVWRTGRQAEDAFIAHCYEFKFGRIPLVINLLDPVVALGPSWIITSHLKLQTG